MRGVAEATNQNPHPIAKSAIGWGTQIFVIVIVTTLEHMARGGVYDQLAGGFHRYSVDERWVVPHFEKMCYDNSELLKNYVHAYQATGEEFFADVARDIIRWMDEWLSDRERGGFYASQDADISMDDDGDYFTWTLDEARAVLTEEEAQVAALHYDINEVGEMHHNPAKNVLVRAGFGGRDCAADESGAGTRPRIAGVGEEENVCGAAAATDAVRGQDRVCGMEQLMRFGLSGGGEGIGPWRMRGGLRCGRWIGCWGRLGSGSEKPETAGESPAATRGMLLHVVSYSDPAASHREVPGMLEDYAFTALACLDAYEATADLSYFKFAQAITDAMIARFYDATSGGFFDSEPVADGKSLGVLATRRKPLQDSPTPAGNPMAAIALIRIASLHRRRRLPGQGRAYAGNFRRRGGAVWNLCCDLRDCGGASAGESRCRWS